MLRLVVAYVVALGAGPMAAQAAAPLAAPPRTITDITAILDQQKPDPAVAARLKACIYSCGDSVEPGAAFRAFRGRDARIEPMLRGRGLIA